MKKTTKFNMTKHKDSVLVDIAGKKRDLVEMIASACYQEKELLDILTDGIFAAVAIHIKEEHGIDIMEYIEARMNEEFNKHKPKERVVN